MFREENFLRTLNSWGRGDMRFEVGATAVPSIHHDRHRLLVGQILSVGTFGSQRSTIRMRRIPAQFKERGM